MTRVKKPEDARSLQDVFDLSVTRVLQNRRPAFNKGSCMYRTPKELVHRAVYQRGIPSCVPGELPAHCQEVQPGPERNGVAAPARGASMAKTTFVIGADFDAPRIRDAMETDDAIRAAVRQPGKGFVWMLRRGRYVIVGNYGDGRAWNGQAQCVPATADDWNYLAAHAT